MVDFTFSTLILSLLGEKDFKFPGVTLTTNRPIRKETMYMCFLSYGTKASFITYQFTFTMSNHNYRSLSRRDTQLNNHYTLYMNSLKDH